MFSCKICNFSSPVKSNYKVHLNSTKHLNNIKNSSNYKCKKCQKKYQYKTAYDNHIFKCQQNYNENNFIEEIDEVEENQETEVSEDNKKIILKSNMNTLYDYQYLNNKINELEIENKNKERTIKDLLNKLIILENLNREKDLIIRDFNNQNQELNKKIHQEKDNKIDIIQDEVMYLKSICKRSGNLVSETISTVNFIINNLTSAPPIDKHVDYKKIIYDNNTKDKMDVIDDIVHHYKHKTLVKYIGDIIVKCYKKEDPSQQSIWNSDISRKNYLLRELINKKLEWIPDKKGVKIKEIIIDPIIKIIDNLIREFLKDDKSMNIDGTINNFILQKRMSCGIELNEILFSIDHKTLHNEVNNYIAQFFYFNKNEYMNNIQPIKKAGRPKIIKSNKSN